MKLKMWASIVVAAVLFIFLASRFYNTVQEDEWKLQRSAVQTAYEKTILTHVTKVENFVGEQVYTIVQGEDKLGQKMVVWVGQDQIYTQMAADGVTQDQVRLLVMERRPDADILRIMPGVLNGALIWEAFYKVVPEEAADNTRYYYDYYAFKDGTYIDTYRLSIE
jgi:uncharacterized protein YpmB